MTGMTVNVDEGLVTPIVQAEIEAALIREFEKVPDVIHKIVHDILTVKVDYKGDVAARSYDQKSTYIEWLCREAVKEAARDALRKYIDGYRDELNKELEKQLMKQKDTIAAALIGNLVKATESMWKFSIYLSAPED